MRICEGCGCSEQRACITADGPCRWVSLEPPLCSACARALPAGAVADDDLADEIGDAA